jgi:hypothetical protein
VALTAVEGAVKKWPLILALCAGLALLALLVWLAVDDARQAALLDARIRQVQERALQASARVNQLPQDGAPAEEVLPPFEERQRALTELLELHVEQAERRQSWHARLLAEVRRRTGW